MGMADLALARRLVSKDHGLVVVSVARPDGSVHASVVNAGVMDDPVAGDPVVAFVARGDAHKLALIRESRRATVTFRAGWEWVSVEGPARLVGPNDANTDDLPGLLRDIFRAAGGTHDDWDEYDRVMAAEGRTAVIVEAARVLTNSRGRRSRGAG